MFRKQPKIKVRPNSTDYTIIKLGWILIALNFVLVLVCYGSLPETVPTHFNFKGEIDGYGHKSTMWFIVLLTAAIYYGLNLFVNKVPAYKHNYPVRVTEKNAPIIYALSIRMMVLLNLFIALVFIIISANQLLIALLGIETHIGVFVVAACVFIAVLPFYFIFKMFKVSK